MPKRVNFISVQHSQSISTEGYTPTPLRTGYERVLSHRVDNLYATIAQQPGVVKSVDGEHITVTHQDGSETTVELGRRFGVAAGTTIPHNLTTTLEVGQAVAPGDTVAFNSDYFTPDSIYPNQVLWKAGVMASTVLWETTDTLEDSCAISQSLSERLTTQMTNKRVIKLRGDQGVQGLVKVGDVVDIESILCTIDNSTEGSGELFDAAALATLKVLSNLTPRAKHRGKVERINVLYRGDPDEFTESLQDLVNNGNRATARKRRKLGEAPVTGEVDAMQRVDGETLDNNSVAIEIYITGPVPMLTGDKGVFGGQLKTTVGRVMYGVNKTESGAPIDAIFGCRSIDDRIVGSAYVMGTTNSLLIHFSKKAVEAYRK